MELSATKLGKKYKTSPLIFFDNMTIMAGGAGGGREIFKWCRMQGKLYPIVYESYNVCSIPNLNWFTARPESLPRRARNSFLMSNIAPNFMLP